MVVAAPVVARVLLRNNLHAARYFDGVAEQHRRPPSVGNVPHLVADGLTFGGAGRGIRPLLTLVK
jgi:hypothetical protein